ncbi:NADH-quinone oxidoreductase subunit J [Neomegalonema perideroedes]|uniref:NADH-quinone oxidoreductase subunit J n=1 Tax=Neomegalonema perideroedes TaxID=217219 RepID=UPI000366745D|nr:NADH-quinone oxidoreductase subunit J [Neomegalonema perideroedes]
MALQAVAFYLFALVAVVAALLVVFARNPVHSVLWLILTFFSAAGLFVLMGAEFLAMLLVIVYVGAVMVLFLFVVMMLDVDFAALRGRVAEYFPLGALIGVILLVQFVMGFGAWSEGVAQRAAAATPTPADLPNAHAIGMVLYTQYVYAFQAAGLVLLVAMIGAIALTLRHREGIKRQDPLAQIHRTREEAMELVDAKPGEGLQETRS